MNVKEKYKIEETATSLSFEPFNHYKKGLIWYVLGIGILIGATIYFYDPIQETFLIISSALLIMLSVFFMKELLMYIPIRYTFDFQNNAVYQKNLLQSKRKIMNLDEIVFFQSSEMGSWHYKMGKKRNQFVKNFQISENFSNSKNFDQKALDFEEQIIFKINEKISSQNESSQTKFS